MKKLLLITLLVSAVFAQKIDTNKSYVQFKVQNLGVKTVTGTIKGMKGTVEFNAENPDSSYFDVTVNVNTINTENTKRDKHLLNEDFFETNKWPTIRFKSKQIANQGQIFGVLGHLTIKNVTKEVFVPFRIIENDKTITFIGGETISRYDYNVGNDFDTFKIGEEITVEVNCIINKN